MQEAGTGVCNMKKAMEPRKRRGALRRAVALLALLSLFSEPLPAAGDDTPADSAWRTMGSAGAVSQGEAVENTYILEISSGTRNGGGAADNVLFFSVFYTSEEGFSHTAIVMPGEDALKKGFENSLLFQYICG